MDNFPLVSVIVPIYNVELYVKECILSVFAQDYQHIELIAVDDCGTDNSIAILEELFKSNPQNISCILFSLIPIVSIEITKLARYFTLKGKKKNENKNNKKQRRSKSNNS